MSEAQNWDRLPYWKADSIGIDRGTEKYMVWNCTCDYGWAVQLDTRTLQRGTVRDCGCETKVKPGQKDLTGQRFGRLVCLEPSPHRNKQGGTPKVFQLLLRKGAFCGFQQLIAYKFPIEQKVLTQFDECGASVETVALLENGSPDQCTQLK